VGHFLRSWLVPDRQPPSSSHSRPSDDDEKDELKRRLEEAKARLQILEWQADVARGRPPDRETP